MVDYVNHRFGNYIVQHLLGRGGFAAVYLGQHQHLGIQAAIKVLDAQLLDSDLKSFLEEAKTQASLNHPNIIRIKEFGVENGIPFLVMDYAPNGTLRYLHPKGTPVPLKKAVFYISQIGSALQYAHDNNLVHRDLKPENILIGSNNEILLSDFGIAIISSSASLQYAQRVAGTPIYMAPEQIEGKARAASDQYALGIIVYEWLCGTPPFQGDFKEITAQHLNIQPPSFQKKEVVVASKVEDVVMRALAKDPQERFASVQEFAIALETSSNGSPKRDSSDGSINIAPDHDGPMLPTPTSLGPAYTTPPLDQAGQSLPPTVLPTVLPQGSEEASNSGPISTVPILPSMASQPVQRPRLPRWVVIIGIFLLLIIVYSAISPLFSGKPSTTATPTSTATQSGGLSVDKTSLKAIWGQSTDDCKSLPDPSLNNSMVWLCGIILKNSAQNSIKWSASVPADSSPIVAFGTLVGNSFQPGGQGTIDANGGQAQVMIRILTSNVVCPKTIPITITPETSQPLPINWQCIETSLANFTINSLGQGGTTLVAKRGTGDDDCPKWTPGVGPDAGWDCQLVGVNNEDLDVSWQATYTPNTILVAFDNNKLSGTIPAHSTFSIKFHVPDATNCSKTTITIEITLNGSDKRSFQWNCADKGVNLNITPTTFNGGNCTWSNSPFTPGWDCTMAVTNPQPSTISWKITSDSSSITFPPWGNRTGSIEAYRTTDIQFHIASSTSCPGTITFTIAPDVGGNPVEIQWNC